MAIKLREVNRADYPFLYRLLKEKEPQQNISHKKTPTYKEHCTFNKNIPYKQDFVIVYKTIPVGRIYLTKNDEVGIAILKKFHNQGIGSRVIENFLKRKSTPRVVYANISPSNFGSQRFFLNHGFKLIQHTYKHAK